MSVDRLDHLYQFSKSEVGGLGVKVDTGVQVVVQMAKQMRAEVRGNSNVLKGVCERVSGVAARCEEGARKAQGGASLGELEMAVLEVEGGLRSRHGEVVRMLADLGRVVRKFGEGGRGGSEGLDLQNENDSRSVDSSTARSGAATELELGRDVFMFGAKEAQQSGSHFDFNAGMFGGQQTCADRQGGAQQPFAAPPMQFYWG